MDKQSAIAIIGLGLRFPGADDQHEFWSNLRSGKDSVETLTAEQLVERGARASVVAKDEWVRRISRLRNAEMFDAGYFSMTPREAQMADPQLRILLEVSQEAIDDSAHVLSGTNTGVFVGAADNDYWVSGLIYNHPEKIGGSLAHRVLVKKDYVATQLAHKLNLTGPSFSISTACSTAAVAVHEAITHLLMHECDFALAGGCEIDEGFGYLYEEGGILSKDGVCRPFDAAANGTVFASGAGIVVLRRYEDAVRDRDHIYGVILGSRLNNDGRQKAGFTAPSVAGQSKVIADAILTAGISARDVSYVEAHGTGTLVGDPIEICALTQAFRRFTDDSQFCALGSVKSNVGHLSIAAGVAGLIKTMLALQHKQIPPILHFSEPNPAIDFRGSPFRVVTRLEEWATDGRPRIAGVSSFGVGGTNSHMLVQEWTEYEPSGAAAPFQVIVASAPSFESLSELRTRLASALTPETTEAALADIAYSLHVGRTEWPARSALVCQATDAHLAARSESNWILGRGNIKEAVGIAFLFPDEGALYPSASRLLYRHEPHFRSHIDACARILESALGRDVRTLLYADPRSEEAAVCLQQAVYAQPIQFAVSYALCELFRSWGIKASALLGAGVGEYVAACQAGVLTLPESLKIVAARGRATDRLRKKGANGARGSSMSGDILKEFRDEWTGVSMHAPRELIVDASGAALTSAQATDIEYWVSRGFASRSFGADNATLRRLECGVFVEMGPPTSLTGQINQAGFTAISALPDCSEHTDDCKYLLQALSRMWVDGVKVDWSELHADQKRNRVSLPRYPFRRNKYALESRAEYPGAVDLKRGCLHPLLGRRWSSSGQTRIYENLVSANNPSFLKDHRLIDTAIFPGAAYAEMALAAARLEVGDRPIRIAAIKFERALMLADEQPCHIQTIVHVDANGGCSFEIARHVSDPRDDAEDSWQTHSTGSFAALKPTDEALEPIDLASLQSRIARPDGMEFIDGEFVKYGPCFRGIKELWTEGQEILARIELPLELRAAAQSYRFHPVLLDSCLQAIGAVTSRIPRVEAALPVSLLNWDIYRAIPQSFWVHIELGVESDPLGDEQKVRNIAMCMFDDGGVPIARIAAYERRELAQMLLQGTTAPQEIMYEILWTEQSLHASVEPVATASVVLILTDDEHAANELANNLADGRECKIAIHDYLGTDAIESAIQGAASAAASRAENLEVVFMRVGERDIDLAALCGLLLNTAQRLVRVADGTAVRVALITKGCQSVCGSVVGRTAQVSGATLWGFGAALSKEHPDMHCIIVDLDPVLKFDARAVIGELARLDGEDLVALRGVTRYAARLRNLSVRDPKSDSDPFKIAIAEFGTFDSLRRREHKRREPDLNDVEVELWTAGMNFKESLIVLGMLDTGREAASDVPMGFEGSGRITKVGAGVRDLRSGDEVIVWANGCLASHITTDRSNVIKFDARKLSYEQAGSLPTVFMTAYFALRVLARIRKEDRVLIHAAAGGVGQAAIQIARTVGAEIYATASRSKWDYLASQGITRSFDSRDLSFRDAIWEATEGLGVTVVLNALAGEFIEKSFDLLAPKGRFIEIGKQNIWSPERARGYRPDVTYHAFELGVGAAVTHSALKDWLRPCLEAIDSGTYQVPPVRVFPLDEVIPAFRWLAAGRNIGKGVIRVRDALRSWHASPIGPDKHYLVSGGLGALGLHVTEWLVRSGAREITLLGRQLPRRDVTDLVRRLRDEGATIRIRNCDVADVKQMGGVLTALPPVAGVFHCAGVIDDGVLVNLTKERFTKVLRPKAYGAQVLHELTLGAPLDYFVCFSSTSALIDGAGQANYSASSAYVDSLVLFRRTIGLAGLSINWGAWAGSGLAADFALRKPGLASEFITKEEGLAAMEHLLLDGRASAAVARMGGRLAKRTGARPLFKDLASLSSKAASHSSELERSPANDPATAIARTLHLEVARVLGVKKEEVRDDDDFVELGIDSLMLAELRNNVQRLLGKKLRATAFFAHPNIRALTQHIVAEHFAQDDRQVSAPKAIGGFAMLSRNRDRDTVFCIPGHGENILDFRHLAESATDLSVCVLHAGESYFAPTFEPDEITFLASKHVAAMRSVQPSGPYRIVAHSFGGVIALEVAIQLLAQDQTVTHLVLLDSFPTFWYRDDSRYRRRAHIAFFSTLFESLGVGTDYADAFYSKIRHMPTDHALRHFRESIATVNALSQKDIDYMVDSFSRRLDIEYRPNAKSLADVRVVHVKATKAAYAFATAEATKLALSIDLSCGAYGWENILDKTAAKLEAVEWECTHKGILRPPFINEVAQLLNGGRS